MVDVEVVREKLIHLEEYINDLDDYTNLKLEKLITDKILFMSVFIVLIIN